MNGEPPVDLLDLRVRDLLDAVADERPLPGAGAVAALATAMAAALVVMAARRSLDSWNDARAVRAQAVVLLDRSMPLVGENALAYEQALRALRGESDDQTLGDLLDRAAQVPLAIAALSADVALLASEVSEAGAPETRADAAAAAALAEAAARAAAELVAANLTVTAEDARVRQAEQLVAAAAHAAGRTRAAQP